MIALFFLVTIAISSGIFAAPSGSWCAQKTTYNASCQNVPFSQVNTKYNYAPTSCDSTTFCAAGTCVDQKQGNCFPNTPEIVCKNEGGAWYDSAPSSVPLCQQGCCLIGDQAAFVTQTRCEQLSSFYNMNTNFRTDINSEVSCIASAEPQAKGACVYETSTGRTCKFTTKQNCQNMTLSGVQGAAFHQGDLCSNPDLGTNCGPTKQTTCLAGQDQVYFVDSCGNPANVYDYSKINNISYWSYIPGVGGVTVSVDASNALENKTNGNCNYYTGSTCREYDKTLDGASNQPAAGDYICRDLNCNSGTFAQEFNKTYGRAPYNGEMWCGSETGSGNSVSVKLGSNPGLSGTTVSDLSKNGNLPGSRDVKFVCYNGVVTTEPCADYRQEICSQSGNASTIFSAACTPNRWRDCYAQTSEANCLDTSKRDCQWVTGISILKSNGNPLVLDNTSDTLVPMANSTDTRLQASCVPEYAPGLSASEAQQTCSIANSNCVVTFTGKALGKANKIQGSTFLGFGVGNGEVTCLNTNGTVVKNWLQNFTNICMSIGDCGISTNYVGGKDYTGLNQNSQVKIVGNVTNNSNS